MLKFTKIALSSLAVASSLFLAPPANAEDLGVSATVTSNCSIVTAPVAFGNYAPTTTNLAAALTAAGSVTVSCTSGSVAHIKMGQGLNPVGANEAAPVRQMASGANRLAYTLYTDEARTDVWGNTDATGVDHTGTGATSGAIPVYGSIAAAQNVPAGSYADTVQATVTF